MKYKNEELLEMYGDYLNNFLTAERFAEYYEIEVEKANEIIDKGRILWDMNLNKQNK